MAALNLKSLAAYLGTAEASAALASTVVDAADAAADAGPLVVFYTNCQGRGLAYWLSKSPAFKRSYPRVRFIAVHDLVDRRAEDFTPAQKALLGACALVVYQPIGAKHGRFATTESGAWALLPQKAKRVGFAYLYDECCFPLYMTRGAVCARGAAAVRAAVARRARVFGLEVFYHNRNRLHADLEAETGATYVDSLDRMLRKVDIVSVNCPHTPATYHLLSARRLRLLPPHATVINTSRGEVIDEGALADALSAGRLGGAGLDVFEREPAVNPRLLELENVVLLPHMSSATMESRQSMGQKVIINIKTFADGHRPPDWVLPSDACF